MFLFFFFHKLEERKSLHPLCRRQFATCSTAIESAFALSFARDFALICCISTEMNEIEFATLREMRWSKWTSWTGKRDDVGGLEQSMKVPTISSVNEIFSAWNCFHCDSKWRKKIATFMKFHHFSFSPRFSIGTMCGGSEVIVCI